jgi:hypothetical protein
MTRPIAQAFVPLTALAIMLTACGALPTSHAQASANGLLAAAGIKRPAIAPKKPVAPAKPVAPIPQDLDSGYLALEFVPASDVATLIKNILLPLGFVDPGKMIPPRDPDVLHATIAFFHKKLPDSLADRFEGRFKGKSEQITINGSGIANHQVAYLTLAGIDDARKDLKGMGLAGDMDDPHITIGASPSNPRDIHGVPKLAQQAAGPFEVKASYHFYFTVDGQMRQRW